MLRRIRLFKDRAGFVLRIMGLELEEIERIPPSEGDRLLPARIKELGLSESAGPLLKCMLAEAMVHEALHQCKVVGGYGPVTVDPGTGRKASQCH